MPASDAAPSLTPSLTLVGESARRLIVLAQCRGISVAELLDELAAMAWFDAAASGLVAARTGDGAAQAALGPGP